MSKCGCCGYSGRARFEYLELLRPLHRRIANQRREITRLLAIEAAWLFEGMAKAEAALAAQRAGLEARVICTQCGGKKWFGDVPCSACNAMGESTVLETSAAHLKPSEAASFDKALARSPRRVTETCARRIGPDENCEKQKGHAGPCGFALLEPDTLPDCFFCGQSLARHANNAQGHAWRRGSSVTADDLALNDETTAALNRGGIQE